MDWISQNQAILSLAVNFVMLLVWMTYLQLFWRSFTRQQQANIIITRGAGPGFNARCLISNMSAEAIYIQGILAVVERNGEKASRALTDLSVISDEDDEQKLPAPGEGPLTAGTAMDLGSFGSLCDAVLKGTGKRIEYEGPHLEDVDSIEIWVMADYSSEVRPVLAKKTFKVERSNGQSLLRAKRIRTRTIRSRAKRQEIEQIFEDHLVAPG